MIEVAVCYSLEEVDWIAEVRIYLAAVPRIRERVELADIYGHAEGTTASFVVDEVAWRANGRPWIGVTHTPSECEEHETEGTEVTA